MLNINLDTSKPTGKLMLTMLAAVAEGKYKGRKATAQAKSAEVLELLGQGMTKQAVADRLGIGIASVFRIVKAV